jgi:hypothetical protein
MLLLPSVVSAQRITPAVSKNFPPSITVKVFEAASRFKLGDSSQLWLAKQYLAEDSLSADLIIKGRPTAAVRSFRDSAERSLWASFEQVATHKEKDAYEESLETEKAQISGRSLEGADLNSQFGMALTLHKELGLNGAQLDSLIEKAQELNARTKFSKDHPDSVGQFDRTAFESQNIRQLLTKEQYDVVLSSRQKGPALTQAKYMWYQVKQKGLTDDLNKDTTIHQLTRYYLRRYRAMDSLAYDRPRMDSLLREIDKDDMPALLQTVAQAGRPLTSIKGRSLANIDMNSPFATALRSYKELKLSDAQIDSVLAAARDMHVRAEQSRLYTDSIGAFDHTAFESERLGRLLTKQQLDTLLQRQYGNPAMVQARNTWYQMSKKAFTSDADKDSTIEQIYRYYFLRLSTAERLASDRTQADSALRRLVGLEPPVLQAWDQVSKKTPSIKGHSLANADMNSQFGMALNQYVELGLTDVQIDSLIGKAREIKIRAQLSKAYPDSVGPFDRGVFESQNMGRLIGETQYRHFLYTKSKEPALTQAKYIWYEIVQRKMDGALNKDTTIERISEYYQARYMTMDRFVYDKPTMNNILGIIERTKKPRVLAAVERARKGDASQAMTSKYVW